MTKVDEMLFYLKEHPKATNQEVAEALGISSDHAKGAIAKQKKRGWLVITGRGENRHIDVLKPFTAEENKEKQKQIGEEVLGIQLRFFRDATHFKKRLRVGNEIRELRKTVPGIGLTIADELIEYYVDDLKQTDDIVEVEKISREIRMLLPELQEGN